MTAAQIAAVLGNARREGRNWRCRCPVHGGCSLTLRDGRNALLVKCWAGCNAHDVLAELRRLRLAGEDCPGGDGTTDNWLDDRQDRKRQIDIARRIWSAARDACGTPVERYLASRDIIIPPPSSLRGARSLRRPDSTYAPAMVARVDSVDGTLIGVHRTWLDRDGVGIWHRRDRASLGPIGGGAVRLAPAAEMLLIGEGIETCLAAMQATAQPAWAALSTSGMMALRLPPEVRTVTILADHDRSGAGQRAAYLAAQRWLVQGRQVRIAMPPEPGADFNDELLGGVHVRITEAHDAAA
jgi:putative DNA primase/helicase